MDDIFRAAQQDVRRENLQRWWGKYGTYAIGGVAAVIIAAGVVSWQQDQRSERMEQASNTYQTALKTINAGQITEAEALLSRLAQESPDASFGLLARFRHAALLIAEERQPEAMALYAELAQDTSIPPLFSDFAAIAHGYGALDKTLPDSATARLENLAESDSPWHYAAQEILGLAALKQENASEALRYLTAIQTDPQAPTPIRERASALVNVLSFDVPQQQASITPEAIPSDAVVLPDAIALPDSLSNTAQPE